MNLVSEFLIGDTAKGILINSYFGSIKYSCHISSKPCVYIYKLNYQQKGTMEFIKLGKQFFNSKMDYPLRYQSENLAKVLFIQFLLVFITLYFFKPFTVNVSEQKLDYLTICFLHALLPVLIIFGYVITLTRFRKSHQINEWTLKKEFLNLAVILLIIGLSGFLLRGLIYTNPDNVSWRYLWIEIRNAYLAGITFYFYLFFTKLYYYPTNDISHSDHVISVSAETLNSGNTLSQIFIKAHVRIDDFSIIADDLLFAKADGNYITLTTFKDGVLKSELKRISLKQLEIQLTAYPYLLRCHRTYLLNVQRVAKRSGNSQGYLISFDRTEDKVPVSRAYINIFDQVYRQVC